MLTQTKLYNGFGVVAWLGFASVVRPSACSIMRVHTTKRAGATSGGSSIG